MRVATGLLLVLLAANTALANDLAYSITTDRSSYAPGDTVSWQTWVTLSNGTANNFGAHTASFGLTISEAGRDTSIRSVGAPFADYTLPSGGTAGSSTLSGVGAAQLGYNANVVEVSTLAPGPTLLFEGSFVTETVGSHTISVEAGASQFYAVASGFAGTNYNSTSGGVASFSTAVPEPSTMILGLLGTVAMIGYSRRRRKAKAAEKSEE